MDFDEPIPARIKKPKETAESKAREDFENMVRKKMLIGPGIDKGGARMVTDQMRAGFVDDECFEEVVQRGNHRGEVDEASTDL